MRKAVIIVLCGLANEVGPIVDAMEERVAEMQAWVDARYAEWHRILEEFFELETGAAN